MPSKDMSQYAPAQWTDNTYEFEIPSGGKCLLRKLDPLVLVEHGLMDKLDFATSVVMNTHAKNANLTPVERVKRDRAKREAKAKGLDPDAVVTEAMDQATMQSIMTSAENSAAFRHVMDQLLVLGVAAPTMHLPPENDDERDDAWFYVDSVPFNDKMAVFNKLMEGVRGVEQFREGPEETVGDVAPKPSVRKSTQRTSRPRAKRSTS
jgi:hypothetical protein